MNNIALAPISLEKAREYFAKHSAFRGEFNLAIAAEVDGQVKGVIAMTADGDVFRKEQISTDGCAFLGSLLYGGMVRVGMALGYKTLTL